jgi:hypothetical protein
MNSVAVLADNSTPSLPRYCAVSVLALLLVLAAPTPALAQTSGPNLLPSGRFENVMPTYVPWAGVDAQGYIHGIEGRQFAVNDDGAIRPTAFGPSVAVADMNGDGKPDLVLADSEGFFWLFLNSGTAQAPAFTQGNIMPIWLGELSVSRYSEGVENAVPRIQLVDLSGTKKYDIIAGNYAGKLFHIPNVGSSTVPVFNPTNDRDSLLINTHRRGMLWCNFLSPWLTSAFGSNSLDLLAGEGTYSANSIYLFHNTGSLQQPSFDEDHMEKIIPGMGLEQLTPTVVDWNNDGKPDVICGSRTGYLNLFLNTSTDPAHPTFAPGVHVKIGGLEKLGNSITVTVVDLNGNHLPNLLIGKDDGTILYAVNTGKLGEPAFNSMALPLRGVLPPTYHHVALKDWYKTGAWGAPYELVSAVNPQLEPGFTFPDGVNSKYAMKFSVWPVTNLLFPKPFNPPSDNDWNERRIRANAGFNLDLNKHYHIHGWIKGDSNVSNMRYRLVASEPPATGFRGYDVTNPINVGTNWTEINSSVEISNPSDPKTKSWNYHFEFRFSGQATFYVDDMSIEEQN